MQEHTRGTRLADGSPFWGALCLMLLLSGSIWLVERHLSVASTVDPPRPYEAQNQQLQRVQEQQEPDAKR